MADVDLLDGNDPYDEFHFQPLPPHREFWYYAELDQDFDTSYGEDPDTRATAPAYSANLISSKTVTGMHAPALDIDFQARLVPSRTKGHFHLYLDKEMPWWKYRILLRVLAWVGIIEPGYYRASVARKATFLRFDMGRWSEDYGKRELQVAQLVQIARNTRD